MEKWRKKWKYEKKSQEIEFQVMIVKLDKETPTCKLAADVLMRENLKKLGKSENTEINAQVHQFACPGFLS